MTDTMLETPGQKADAIHAAVKNEENCMVFVPYPIGWVTGVKISQISIGVDRLDDVEMSISSISGNITFKVKPNDD